MEMNEEREAARLRITLMEVRRPHSRLHKAWVMDGNLEVLPGPEG